MNTKEEILKNCTVEGLIVKLPNVQLERKLYQEVAKSLELIGGKWKGGKISGFVFQIDPTDLLAEISEGSKRNLKKEFQFFATPEKIAKQLVGLAELNDTDTILEPSAGQGAIIKEINEQSSIVPDCFELMDINMKILNESNLSFNVLGNDFLTNNLKNESYSKIIANPPFTKNQDIIHLKEMFRLLKKNGRLVCITSESWKNSDKKIHKDFEKWLIEVKAKHIHLEKGTFKESGTMVSANIIIINK